MIDIEEMTDAYTEMINWVEAAVHPGNLVYYVQHQKKWLVWAWVSVSVSGCSHAGRGCSGCVYTHWSVIVTLSDLAQRKALPLLSDPPKKGFAMAMGLRCWGL